MSMQNRLLGSSRCRSLYHKIRIVTFSTTSPTLPNSELEFSKATKQKTAQLYNDRRAAYKKAVGKLRKQYADEVTQQRLTDEKAEAEERARLTRKRLERQRAKNIRSVKNAIIQEEVRVKRAKEFEEELRVAQINREARADRFDKARRLVVQELNEESVHWMASEEEVDAALDGTVNEQKLWTRQGGYVGAPMPTEDAEFWRFESHTWEMSKTYKTPREKFFEDLLEQAYYDSNLKASYWSDEAIEFQTELEEKAKLRALVRMEGRKALLKKQQEMLRDINTRNSTTGTDGMPAPPRPAAVPSLDILADYEAMEAEGVKILEKDPSKFFVFDSTSTGEDGDKQGGQTMGKPLGLRDPVRDGSPTGTPYPEILGRVPKKDTRTQKEIKRQEREERMWAAAAAEASSDVDSTDEEDVAETNEPTDYAKLGNFGDQFDKAWEEGLDPVKDADLYDTPRQLRFDDDDTEWLKEKLATKIANLEEIVSREEMNELQRLGIADTKSSNDEDNFELGAEDLAELQESSVIESLNEVQIAAMIALSEEPTQPKTPEEIKESLRKVPGLTDEQIESIVELEMSLLQKVEGDK